MINKPLPNNIDAEKELLSMVFIQNDLMADLITILKPNDFYYTGNSIIYSKMTEMYSKNIAISAVTLINSLNKDVLKSIGVTYITEISGMSLTVINFKHYMNIVKELSNKRNIIKGCINAIDEAYEIEEESKNIVDKLESNFMNMSEYEQEGTVNAYELMECTFNSIEKGYNNGGKIQGMSTGYSNLDNAINGLVKQDLILIAARPSMGEFLPHMLVIA